ncbi:hypothetical protein [Micromonospora viridifaciens]|uniref:hypothetical protein n=1 Tax=Micromonospora viridifaciens TaxID=1881 RepID=UPI0012FDBB6C|nr:hypothetical protein [Micromonospora viridifaciens]
MPSDKALRAGLYGWVFNKARRDAGEPPADLAAAVRWLTANTVDPAALADAALVRKALDTLALRWTALPRRPARSPGSGPSSLAPSSTRLSCGYSMRTRCRW